MKNEETFFVLHYFISLRLYKSAPGGYNTYVKGVLKAVTAVNMEKYMREALALAREAMEAGEIPVGCVVVDGEGRVIGRGRNRREERRSVCGHAEIEALEDAARCRGDWRMDDCALFVSLEPCPMCAGAMIMSRLGTLVYGAREEHTGSAASILNLFEENYPGHTAIYGGVLAEESAGLLREFFGKMRETGGLAGG